MAQRVARWLADQVFKAVANWKEGVDSEDDDTVYLQCGKVRRAGGGGCGCTGGRGDQRQGLSVFGLSRGRLLALAQREQATACPGLEAALSRCQFRPAPHPACQVAALPTCAARLRQCAGQPAHGALAVAAAPQRGQGRGGKRYVRLAAGAGALRGGWGCRPLYLLQWKKVEYAA